MGDDESSEGDGAVVGFKAAAWADVELKCSIETFDELFQWSKKGGLFVEILETDDLTVFNAGEFFGALSV